MKTKYGRKAEKPKWIHWLLIAVGSVTALLGLGLLYFYLRFVNFRPPELMPCQTRPMVIDALPRPVIAQRSLEQPELVGLQAFLNSKLAIAYAGGQARELGAPNCVDWSILEGEQVWFSRFLREGEQLRFNTDLGCKFSSREGFLSHGNGVCVLGSLTKWVCTEAGLRCSAWTPHRYISGDILGVPDEHDIYIASWFRGIFDLWITNTLPFPVIVQWEANWNTILVSVFASD